MNQVPGIHLDFSSFQDSLQSIDGLRWPTVLPLRLRGRSGFVVGSIIRHCQTSDLEAISAVGHGFSWKGETEWFSDDFIGIPFAQALLGPSRHADR